jgi:hypothetical protein
LVLPKSFFPAVPMPLDERGSALVGNRDVVQHPVREGAPGRIGIVEDEDPALWRGVVLARFFFASSASGSDGSSQSISTSIVSRRRGPAAGALVGVVSEARSAEDGAVVAWAPARTLV